MLRDVARVMCIVLLIGLPGWAEAQRANCRTRTLYKQVILAERADKNKEFRTDSLSPVVRGNIKGFERLEYYPPRMKYCVKARLERFPKPDTILMRTTTSRLPVYLVYGLVHFELNKKECSLTVFRNVALSAKPGFEDYLFLPFTDHTSNRQTYGGGRFLDLHENTTDSIMIDFNKAYNPYCAYSHIYSCPVPPDQNRLPMEVKAGEKAFKLDD